jgi:hypothetical protein
LLYKHVGTIHADHIPSDNTVRQYCFNRRNNKTFQLCTICKKNKTEWNEETGKYNRLCKDPACRKKSAELANENLKRKTGKDRSERMSDPDVQREMQYNRSISGSYTMRDKITVIKYMGSYELDFLQFYDIEFLGNPVDLLECPITFEYLYDGAKHFYIPDYYIPTLNLIIEIKEGGDDPNNHPKYQEIDKAKEKLKDQAIIQSGKYNFIKVVNKDYTDFINAISILRERNGASLDEHFQPLIVIPE